MFRCGARVQDCDRINPVCKFLDMYSVQNPYSLTENALVSSMTLARLMGGVPQCPHGAMQLVLRVLGFTAVG